MNGSFMLMAFAVGFWCIWSANRDVNSLLEAIGLNVLAIVVKAIMEWNGAPNFDTVMVATWGALWIYTVFVLEMVERFSSSMGKNLTIAVLGSIGWFGIAQYLFSADGQKMVAAWVS